MRVMRRSAGPRSLLARRWRDRHGQGLVEFAMVSVALIVLLLGGTALVMGVVARMVTTNAARDAARVAAIDCGAGTNYVSASQQAVYQDLSGGGQVVQSSPSSSAQSPSTSAPGAWDWSVSCSGGNAAVQVWYNAPDVFPLILHSLGVQRASSFFLTATATFPVE